MGDLTERLNELVDALESRGSGVRSRLQPNPDRARIAAKLEAAGLTPLEALVDWFAFTDGLAQATGDHLFYVDEPNSLDAALDDHRAFLRDLGDSDDEVFKPSMLPILRPDPDRAIETAPGKDQGKLFWIVWEGPAEPFADSLADYIADQIGKLASGELVLGPNHEIFERPDLEAAARFDPSDWRRSTYFSLKPLEPHPEDWRVDLKLERIAGPDWEYRLTCFPAGSIDGNQGMELAQRDATVQMFIDRGIPAEHISVGVEEPTSIYANVIGVYRRPLTQ